MNVKNINEMQLQGKYAMKQQEKESDINAFHEFKDLVETTDTRRMKDRTERQDRIKKLLNRMPAITVQQTFSVEKEIDSKIKSIQERREYEEKQKDIRKREDIKRQNDEMKWLLDIQVQEKRAREQNERIAN